MQVVLTIAGSDSSSGAGVQADIKTFQGCGVYGLCAVTAVTAQDGRRVDSIFPLAPRAVSAQIESVLSEIDVCAVKTGMLWNDGIVRAVSRGLLRRSLHPIVVDPIILSQGGRRLLTKKAEGAMKKYLFPLADLVTPNVSEAELLTGLKINGKKDILEATMRLMKMGPGAVLITGERRGSEIYDWLYDGERLAPFRSARLGQLSLHGSGCILSAAIAACLAKGQSLKKAITNARLYVRSEMKRSWAIGNGVALALHS